MEGETRFLEKVETKRQIHLVSLPEGSYTAWMKRNSNSPFQRNEIDCKSWHCWGKGEKNASSGKESRASHVCTYISAHVQGVSFRTWNIGYLKDQKFHTRMFNNKIGIIENETIIPRRFKLSTTSSIDIKWNLKYREEILF